MFHKNSTLKGYTLNSALFHEQELMPLFITHWKTGKDEKQRKEKKKENQFCIVSINQISLGKRILTAPQIY